MTCKQKANPQTVLHTCIFMREHRLHDHHQEKEPPPHPMVASGLLFLKIVVPKMNLIVCLGSNYQYFYGGPQSGEINMATQPLPVGGPHSGEKLIWLRNWPMGGWVASETWVGATPPPPHR